MTRRVFVTGGGGFVGSAVIDELIRREYSVAALTHRKPIDTRGGRVQSIDGDLFDNKALDRGIAGCDAVIHLVGIIFERPSRGITFQRIHVEGTRSVVDATRRNGVRRYLHMSALGTRPHAVSTYHKTKFAAEQDVRASGLDWTIFRPSMIHGPGGELMQMEAAWARGKAPPFLFMPYFGSGALGRGGAGVLQPVYVEDVARAFVEALERPQTIGEVYPLGGPDRMTWSEMHHAAAEAIVHRKRLVMPVPAWYAKLLTRVAPRALLPFNRDQVVMSAEDNVCDIGKARSDLEWEPRGFRETVMDYGRNL